MELSAHAVRTRVDVLDHGDIILYNFFGWAIRRSSSMARHAKWLNWDDVFWRIRKFKSVFASRMWRIKRSNTHRMGRQLVSPIPHLVRRPCKRALYKRRYSAKETYNLIDPTHLVRREQSGVTCINQFMGVFIYMWFLMKMSVFSPICHLVRRPCKRALHKRRYSAKETYNLKEPTENVSLLIWRLSDDQAWFIQIKINLCF